MNKSKEEVAALAAKLIVEDGFSYYSAKNQATDQIFLNNKRKQKNDNMPSNLEIESAIKTHIEIFHKNKFSKKLIYLKKISYEIMSLLQEFKPVLIGLLAADIATNFNTIRLCCFSDSSKEINIMLLENNIKVNSLDLKHPYKNLYVEGLTFIWKGEEVYIYTLMEKEPRVALRGLQIRDLKKQISY